MKLQENPTKSLLDYFFEFINFDLNTLDFDNIVVVSMGYVRFVFHQNATKSKARYDLLTNPSFDRSEKNLQTIKEFLGQVQTHFKNVLDKILELGEPEPITKHAGVRELSIKGEKFIEVLKVNSPPIGSLDSKAEIIFIEAMLSDLILNGELLPKMFNQCDQCNNYFYQKTKRTGVRFCSTKCLNLNKQKAFQDSKAKIRKVWKQI